MTSWLGRRIAGCLWCFEAQLSINIHHRVHWFCSCKQSQLNVSYADLQANACVNSRQAPAAVYLHRSASSMEFIWEWGNSCHAHSNLPKDLVSHINNHLKTICDEYVDEQNVCTCFACWRIAQRFILYTPWQGSDVVARCDACHEEYTFLYNWVNKPNYKNDLECYT